MDRRALLKNAALASVGVVPALYGVDTASAEPEAVAVLVAYGSVTGNTERMAQGVAEGAAAAGAGVVLKRVGDVTTDDLLSADGVVVGSPVYFGSLSGEVKTFLDDWLDRLGVFRGRKMRNKVGAAFATGGSVSSGKEVAMLAILAAMLMNQMIIVSGVGFGASATTGPDSPGVDDKELAEARELGRRVAEVAAILKRGTSV